MVIFRERYDGDAERFESALKKAKASIHEACDIFGDMKEEFGERGYGERYDGRYSSRSGDYGEREHYHRDSDWGERRDSRGRYM